MHMLVEETISVRRAAHEVFAYVSNMERFGEWFPDVVSITSSDGLPHGEVGKVYLETVRVPFRGKREIALQVREARAPHFFATEGHLRPLLPRMEISITATAPDACTLSWSMFSRSHSTLGMRWVVLPMARLVMERRAAQGVATLKARLEDSQSDCCLPPSAEPSPRMPT